MLHENDFVISLTSAAHRCNSRCSNISPICAHRQANSLNTACILALSSFVNMLTLHFASFLDVLFLQCGLQKVYFSGCQFQNRTYNNSLETRESFEIDLTLKFTSSNKRIMLTSP